MSIDPPTVMILVGSAVQAAGPVHRIAGSLRARSRGEQVVDAMPFLPLPWRRAPDLDAMIASID